MPERMDRNQERQAGVKALIEEFNGGKEMYFRHHEGGRWMRVRGINEIEGAGPGWVAVVTPETEEDSLGSMVYFESLKHMQDEAKMEGAESQVSRVESSRTLDESDRSPEGKRRLFEARYKPHVVRWVTHDLIRGESEPDSAMTEVMDDFQAMARGEREGMFEGWKKSDYIDLLKMFDEADQEIREQMEKRLEDMGIKPDESRALIERAKREQAKLDRAEKALSGMYGVSTTRK
jgi:hypothetical protein